MMSKAPTPFVELRLSKRGLRVSRVVRIRPQEQRAWFAPRGAHLDSLATDAAPLVETFEVFFALG